jgi:deoxycytidylate deaminase
MFAAGIKKIKYINDYKNDILVDIFAKQMNIEITQIL